MESATAFKTSALLCVFAIPALIVSPAKALVTIIYTFDNDGASPITPAVYSACRTNQPLTCGAGSITGSFRYTPSTGVFTNIDVVATFSLFGGNNPLIANEVRQLATPTIAFADTNQTPDAAITTNFQSIIDAGGWGVTGAFQSNAVTFCSNANLGTNSCANNALASSNVGTGDESSVWLVGREVPSSLSALALLPLGLLVRLRRRYQRLLPKPSAGSLHDTTKDTLANRA